MRTSILALIVVASVHGNSADVLNRDQPNPSSILTLRVYNYAGIKPLILNRAKRHTDRIFKDFGIETAWLDCPTSPEDMAFNRSCAARIGAHDLALKLLPASMSKRFGFKTGIFGFALPTADGVPGNHISLFVARVLDPAYHGSVGASFENAQEIILGHMMAHEIGHLLLGPNSHSRRGVMSFPWGKRTLTNMERGRLRFTAKGQSRIEQELGRRSEVVRTLATFSSQ